MNPNLVRNFKETSAATVVWLGRAFDAVANWVTQLSWWKFFIFFCVVMAAGGLMNDALFENQDVVVVGKNAGKHATHKGGKVFSDGESADIQIDDTGIHIRKNPKKAADAAKADSDADASTAVPAVPPTLPAAPAAPAAPATPRAPTASGADVHIPLPPEVGQEVSDAIEEAVDDAAEQKIESYRKTSSKWFMNFILAIMLGLFGMKALMGGKKRAEARASAANAAAEREALQRQVSEAKMQMMQAQVEPHFLFNTLASVEYLIETDPPRASKMQRSLIQYLRAVLPQMREATPATTLGRECDIVRAYLDLLKMRMEERLQVEFAVPDGLRSASFPPMMLQSLVENAIKHGLEAKEEGGTLRVSAEIFDSRLRVSVSDDGLGFGAIPSNGTGLGLQSIRERLKLLFGDQAQLIIVPNTPSGVRVTIEVPYQLATNHSNHNSTR
jgi:signal transduction histidine kinase